MRLRSIWLGLVCGACSSGSLALGRIEGTEPDAAVLDDAGERELDASDDAASCSVDGIGTTAPDRLAGGAAELRGGATMIGDGVVRLDGVDDYVALPSGLLAGLEAVTILVWVRHLGGPAYTRVLDIGVSSLGANPPVDASTVGRSYMVLTPSTGFVPNQLAALLSTDGPPNEVVASSDTVLDAELHHVGISVDAASLTLWHDGAVLARVPKAAPLSAIADDDAWLGRSQYAADPYLRAEYRGVYVYPSRLDECQVQALFRAGP